PPPCWPSYNRGTPADGPGGSDNSRRNQQAGTAPSGHGPGAHTTPRSTWSHKARPQQSSACSPRQLKPATSTGNGLTHSRQPEPRLSRGPKTETTAGAK